MRVYFSGCHGSGKSTLARYVSKKYNLPMITECARMILSEEELHVDSLRNNLDVTDDYQLKIFNRQLLEENKYKSFISDRSILDVLAYSAQHARILPSLMLRPELPANIDSLKLSDSILFFVRPSHATLRSDGVRESLNWDGAVAIDAMIKLLIQMFGIKCFTIDTDNMQERVDNINNILSFANIKVN